MFNLADDPFEQKDLAASEPQRLNEMMKKLIAQLEAHKALYPVDDNGQPVKPQLPPSRS